MERSIAPEPVFDEGVLGRVKSVFESISTYWSCRSVSTQTPQLQLLRRDKRKDVETLHGWGITPPSKRQRGKFSRILPVWCPTPRSTAATCGSSLSAASTSSADSGFHSTLALDLYVYPDEVAFPDDLDSAVLGEGVYGKVVRATYQGQPAAVKLYKGPPRPDDFREAEVLSQLRGCPNIVKFRGILPPMEHLSDKESLVMEFVQGHTMVHLYNNEDNTITKLQTLNIVTTLADGLAQMHHRDISHGDLKPDNVLLTPVDGPRGYRAIIIDLGNARIGGGISYAVTPADAEKCPQHAPELLHGGCTSTASDVYSLGWILGLLAKTQGLVEDLNQVICEALQRDPDVRPDAASIHSILRHVTESEAKADVPNVPDGFMARAYNMASSTFGWAAKLAQKKSFFSIWQ